MSECRYQTVCLLTALSLAVSAGSASSQQKTIKDQIVGTWETVSVIQERDDGSKNDLFGGKVSGRFIYTADGQFVQLNTRMDTPKIASGNRQTTTPEEAKVIVQQSYGAFGTYTANEADGTHTVRIVGSTFPNEVGREQVRKVSFSGDQMMFVNPAPASGGKGVTNTLRRVK